MFKKFFIFLIFIGILIGVIYFKKNDFNFKVPVWGQDNLPILSELLIKNNLSNFPVYYQDDAIVASVSGLKVLFPKNGDYPKSVKALQTVLSAVTMDGEIRIIDLRFDKPVLKK